MENASPPIMLTPKPLERTIGENATRYVCSKARSVADARYLLDVLGLLPKGR